MSGELERGDFGGASDEELLTVIRGLDLLFGSDVFRDGAVGEAQSDVVLEALERLRAKIKSGGTN